MMEDHPVKHGQLLFLARPGKILKKAWQKKYLALFKASGYAVQRAEMFDSYDQFLHNASAKIVPLNECIKVAQAPQKNQQNVFEVITKVQTYHYSAETTQELAEWVHVFQKVAFGGSLSSPSTPTSSQVSLVSQPCFAEEKVNDIYSPIYGSEKYAVQIMETDAAIVCGLAGHYQLVVNQLELLLCEAGTSSSDTALFGWSYRHIRRYGRNKDTFSFEAGRKCSSGEGIFKFVTNEANTIFQSVQANTKNIKRDAEGSGVPTGSSISSLSGLEMVNEGFLGISSRTGSSRSIPPMKTAFNSEAGENNHQNHGMTSDSPRRSVSTDQLITRTRNVQAPLPFMKPPRKSKTSLDSSRSAEPIRLEISKAAIARLASGVLNSDGIDTVDTRSTSPGSLEPTYSEPEMRTDAWKMFALEADNIHEEKLISEADDSAEAYYSSVPYTPSSTTVLTCRSPGLLDINDGSVPKMVNTAAKRPSIDGVDCYDHLSQFGEPPPPASKSNAVATASCSGHHIYSRLLSSSSSGPGTGQPHNRSTSQDQSLASSTDVTADPVSDGIPRFVQNEDIYTVVLKPSKKGN